MRRYDCLVVGGGAFGTTLASLFANSNKSTLLWIREPEIVEEVNNQHTNTKFLSGFSLPEKLVATNHLKDAVPLAKAVLIVVPSKYFRDIAREVGEVLEGDQILVHASKGIEIDTGKRMSEILREETCALKIGVISGPNLAREIMKGHPAGIVVASKYDEVIHFVKGLFNNTVVRAYAGRDVIGVEIGGSFKNIIALAAGGVEGLGFGDNSKAMLLTRGLSEMVRYGVALGANPLTFSGLAGIGDLMATSFSPLSRNFQVGRKLALGEDLEIIQANMVHIAEGVSTTKAVYPHSKEIGLDLHIVRAVHGVLFEGWKVINAIEYLLGNPVGEEITAIKI